MPTDDSDADDTPSRKPARRRAGGEGKKRKKAKRSKGMTRGQVQMLVFGGIGAALLIAAVVTACVLLLPVLFPTPDKTINGIGWYEGHEDVNYTVQAYFPGQKPTYEKHGMKIPDGLAKMGGGNTPSGDDLSWNVKLWGNTYKGREYAMFLWTFPGKGSVEPGLMERTVLGQRLPQPGAGVTQVEEQITLSGKRARRVVVQGPKGSTVYVTIATDQNQMFSASVSGPGTFDQTDPMVTAFFDNVTVK